MIIHRQRQHVSAPAEVAAWRKPHGATVGRLVNARPRCALVIADDRTGRFRVA